ncbi:MAG: MerR family transcriptional regulator [Acidimicrobiales bacterium]
MTTPFLRIGPFSRASSISVKALRAYHEQGILVPSAVDPTTGYRVYSAEQLFDAAVLRRLRDLDLPLRQVREVLVARDPAVTERVLAAHAQVMHERMAQTARIIDELQRGLRHPLVHTPVHVREVPAQHALAVRASVSHAEFGAFLGEAFPRLFALAERLGAVPAGAPAGRYPQLLADDGVEDATALVPIAAPVEVPAASGCLLGEVPGGPKAVAVHLGEYDTIGDTYQLLGGWVATHTSPRDGDVVERYLVGPPEPVEAYRTEIEWPVEATHTPGERSSR